MKRVLSILLAMIIIISLAGCGGIDPESKRYAFITDPYGINSSPEVESVWLGIRDYSNVLPCVATSYTPIDDTVKEYKAQIKTAVKDGAKIVVCYGENMSVPVYNGQKDHKKIKFVLIDALPMSEGEYKEKHKDDPEKEEAPAAEPGKTEEGNENAPAEGEDNEAAPAEDEDTENAPAEGEGTESETQEGSGSGGDASTEEGSSDGEDSESEETASAEVVKMGVFLTASEDASDDAADSPEEISPESPDEGSAKEGQSGEAAEEESEEASDGTENIRENTCVVKISFRDVGFLAGYAAVAEGFTNIAFMGGAENETNDIYLNGFIEGADTAAKERAVAQGGVNITYVFTGSEELSPVTMSKAMALYENGVQTIFAPGDSICKAVVKAAETRQSGSVMTVGTQNKRSLSEKIVFTAIMNYGRAAYSVLEDFENDEFEGGKIVNYGLKEECVTIPDDLSGLTAFTSNTFEILKNNIKSGQTAVGDKDLRAGGDVVNVTAAS